MELSLIAIQGLQQANAQLESAASKIASPGASSPTGANLDSVDLSAAMIALLDAKNLYAANANIVKIADQVQQSTIDMMA